MLSFSTGRSYQKCQSLINEKYGPVTGDILLNRRRELSGMVFMLSAAIVFSLNNIFVKMALNELPFMETVFFRGAFGTLFAILALRLRNTRLIGPRPGLLFLRGAFGFLGLTAYFFAMSKLAIADAVILNKASPLFVMILSYFLLGEILSRWHLVLLCTAIFGVYNVLQPQMRISPLAGVVGLSSAVFSACAYIVVKKLSLTHGSLQIVMAFSAVSTVFSIPFLFHRFTPPTPKTWIVLLAIGLGSVIAQTLMTKAYALASPTPVSIASYSVVVFSAVWAYIIFGEIQDRQALIGTFIVLASLTMLPVLARRSGMRIRPEPGPINSHGR